MIVHIELSKCSYPNFYLNLTIYCMNIVAFGRVQVNKALRYLTSIFIGGLKQRSIEYLIKH